MSRYTEVFLQNWGFGSELTLDFDLEASLGEVIQRAQSGYPDIRVAPEGFVAFLAERSAPERLTEQGLRALPASDLWLACGCLSNNKEALDVFAGLLRRIAERLSPWRQLSHDEQEELVQEVWVELVVPKKEASPDLGKYLGRGSLAGWLRMVLKRRAWRRGKTREDRLFEESLLGGRLANLDGAPPLEPELAFMKAHYRVELKNAFHGAMRDLDEKERSVLRQYVLEGKNIARIGELHGVHRATVARWLAAIRQRLLTSTHERLRDELGVGESEVDSIVGLVASQLDDSFTRLARSKDET